MNAQQLKNAILQEAIEGRLVPQDPNDEPASVLLQRIRKEKERLVKEGKLKKKDLEEKPISEEEKPFEIPEGWEWCRIGTIASVLGGKRIPAGRKLSQENTGHIYIRVSDMKDDTVSTDNLLYVPEDIFPSISKYIIKKEDVYITVAGTIGRIGKIPPELDGANLTENADRIVFSNINQDWLIKCLQSYFVQKQITDVTTKVGQPKLAILRIQDLLFPLPPLAEQHRIVAKIEELLPKVEEYGKAQEALDKLNAELPEKLKKSILQEAISGRLVPQDPNDEPASILLDRIRQEKQRLVKEGKLKKKDLEEIPISEDEIPFEIPESWAWVKLGNIYVTTSGGTPEKGHPEYYGGNIPWVKVGDLTSIFISHTEDCISEEGLIHSSAKLFPKDTILVAMYCNDAIGKSSIITRPMTTNQAICGLFPNAHLMKEYIYYAIQSNRKKLQEQSAGGAQKNINQKIVNNLLVPLPPLAEQHRIVAKLEQLFREIDKLNVK